MNKQMQICFCFDWRSSTILGETSDHVTNLLNVKFVIVLYQEKNRHM
jgi:hypothetical protein